MLMHMGDTLMLGIVDYFLHQGQQKMSEILPPESEYVEFAQQHDSLVWDTFLEGQVQTSLFQLQQGYLLRVGSPIKLKTWSTLLVQHLLSITHRQWLYHNIKVKIRKVEGKTTAEHSQVLDKVKQMMLIDPSDLLLCH